MLERGLSAYFDGINFLALFLHIIPKLNILLTFLEALCIYIVLGDYTNFFNETKCAVYTLRAEERIFRRGKRASRQRNDLFEYTRGTHKLPFFCTVILNLAENIIVIYFLEQLESNYMTQLINRL